MNAPPKTTPGPWQAIPYGGSAFFIHSVSKGTAARIATVSYTDGAHSYHEADANLIAAAPCMAGYIKKRAAAGDAEAIELWGRINAHS